MPSSDVYECVFMAIHNPQRALDGVGFSFEDCSFEAPLAIDKSRHVSVLINDKEIRTGWSFKAQSLLKEEARSRSMTYVKGKLGFKSKLEMLHYQQLIFKCIQQLSVDERLESLRGERVYRLFSRVINYSPIFREISTFKVLDNKALAEIVVPDQVQTAESTVISVCDAVALDIFLQVCGLLLNCHQSCGDDEVFLAIGVDNVSASMACNIGPGKLWTVYTTFVAVTETNARGDVWVLWPDGTLAVTMIGVHFTKTPSAMLYRLLDSSNVKNSAKSVTQAATPPILASSISSDSSSPVFSASSQESLDSN